MSKFPEDPKSAPGRGIALLLWDLGFPAHRIAALFDCNQGRISEVVTGKAIEDPRRNNPAGG